MVDTYSTLKLVHMVSAALSISGFLWRASLQLRQSPQLAHKAFRIVPHINDTVLLLCGVAMAALARFNPVMPLWLAGKLVLLVAYILCGLYVLKWAGTRAQQLAGTGMAVLCFGGIVLLALWKPF